MRLSMCVFVPPLTPPPSKYLTHCLQVTNPQSGGTCKGSKPCTVEWLDDGTAPLLSHIGVCTVGLYTGQEVRLPLRREAGCNSLTDVL